MNFENFKFIPKNNTRDNSASLNDLIELKTPKEIDWVVKREGDRQISFKSSFLQRENGWGYTVCLSPDNKVYLVRCKENNENKALEPMFLKGDSGSSKITNEYFDLLLSSVYNENIHFQCNIVEDNVWEIIPSVEEEFPTFKDLTVTVVPTKTFSSLADLAESLI